MVKCVFTKSGSIRKTIVMTAAKRDQLRSAFKYFECRTAGEGVTISEMLNRGDIDGFIAPRPPAGSALTNPNVGWLFDDPTAAAKDYFRRTGIFPIMHVVGVRKTLVDAHPWVPAALQKAFTAAKQMAFEALCDTSATKVTLPFVEEQLKAARDTLGPDYWSYGVAGNEGRSTPSFVTIMRKACPHAA